MEERFNEVNTRLDRIEEKIDRLLDVFTLPDKAPQETDLLAAPTTK